MTLQKFLFTAELKYWLVHY